MGFMEVYPCFIFVEKHLCSFHNSSFRGRESIVDYEMGHGDRRFVLLQTYLLIDIYKYTAFNL